MSNEDININNASFAGMAEKTQGSGEELGNLIVKLVNAAEPLKGKFEGRGWGSFSELKERAEAVSHLVNKDLGSLNEGQVEMLNAVLQGDQAMEDATRSQMSAANFDVGKFRA